MEPYARFLEEKTNAGNTTRTFTVPSGVIWEVDVLQVKMVNDATVANRLLVVAVTDSADDPVFTCLTGPNQAASATRYYFVAAGLLDDAAFVDTDKLSRKLPQHMRLPTGSKIKVSFTAGVAGDNFECRLIVLEQPLNV